jgi:hypothetical protein
MSSMAFRLSLFCGVCLPVFLGGVCLLVYVVLRCRGGGCAHVAGAWIRQNVVNATILCFVFVSGDSQFQKKKLVLLLLVYYMN